MEGRRAALGDVLLYGASTAVALAGVAAWTIPVQRAWARAAWPWYALATVAATIALLLVRRRRAAGQLRIAICAVVFLLATIAPLAAHVAGRHASGIAGHVQSETLIVEAAAEALVDGRNPYAILYAGDLASWPLGTRSHFAYLPGMTAFGLPHAAWPGSVFADARVWFLLGTVLLLVLALRAWPRATAGRLRVFQVLLALPTGGLLLAGGGDDLPVLALLLLSFVLLERGHPVGGGVTAGIAAAMKQTAWPVLPFIVLAARDPGARPAGRRAATAALLVFAVVVLPFAVAGPAEMFEDVILYPLGMGDQPTLAGGASLGALLVDAFPVAKVPISLGLLALAAGVGLVLLTRRPRPSPAAAAGRAAAFLLTVVALAPAGRPGYLVYPANLLAWSLTLRPSTQSGGTAEESVTGSRAPPVRVRWPRTAP
jgi:Glycosyltransferase family 87